MAQTDQERKDSQNKRKIRQRAREKTDPGKPKIYPLPLRAGTSAAVDRLKKQYDFDTAAEMITYLIHNLDAMSDCDTVTKEQFMGIPSKSRAD